MAESQVVEWKESWRDDYLKWICGFANAQGGVLEVGRDDRGKVVGVRNVLRLLEEIPNKVQSILGIVVDVNLKSEDGTEYLEIVVGSYPNPISFRGEFHYRSGATKQVLRGAALNQFLMRKHGRTWDDVIMPGVRIRDLDGRALTWFRRAASNSKRLSTAALAESDASLVEKLGLREGEHLKRAAVLLFHPTPQRFIGDGYVKVGYFHGSELLFQDVIEEDLFTQVDRTLDLLFTKYTKALVSYRGLRRVETFPLPEEAVREAVVNAVAHRDYTIAAPIQIRVYDNRIVLWNPGGLPEGWSLDKLTGIHPSRPRNPVVANAFFRAGLIEAWGQGIQRIIEACQAEGDAVPKWRIEPDGVWLELPFPEAYVTAHDRMFAGHGGIADTTHELESETMSPLTTRERILALMEAEPRITRGLMAERIGITPDGVKYHLTRLRKAGIIRHVGPRKAGRWEVLK